MPKSKKKKSKIECDHCGGVCIIEIKTKKLSIQCCPFCGEAVQVRDDDNRPLLNNFDDLDNFDERNYYADDEELEDD
jgi:predicted RNA-binding Zn-ribbon protein involved in translation (DUF1610 family)